MSGRGTRGRRRGVGTSIHRVGEIDGAAPASGPLKLRDRSQAVAATGHWSRGTPRRLSIDAHTPGTRPLRRRHGARWWSHADRPSRGGGGLWLCRRIARWHRRQGWGFIIHRTRTGSRTPGRLVATKSAIAHGAGAADPAEILGTGGPEIGLRSGGCPALNHAFGLNIFNRLGSLSETSKRSGSGSGGQTAGGGLRLEKGMGSGGLGGLRRGR